jgi:C-terminal processing protease CtpA/Prc
VPIRTAYISALAENAIGIESYIGLADGTFTTQPEFAYWFNDLGWGVENHGVDPIEEVDYPPQDFAAGRDPQLERGIAEALRSLRVTSAHEARRGSGRAEVGDQALDALTRPGHLA